MRRGREVRGRGGWRNWRLLFCDVFVLLLLFFLILHNSRGEVAGGGGTQWGRDKAIMHDYMHVFVFVHADTCVHTCVCVCVSLRVYLFAFALSCLIFVCFNDAVATLANTCCLTYGHAYTRTSRRGSVLKCKSFLTYNYFAAF